MLLFIPFSATRNITRQKKTPQYNFSYCEVRYYSVWTLSCSRMNLYFYVNYAFFSAIAACAAARRAIGTRNGEQDT